MWDLIIVRFLSYFILIWLSAFSLAIVQVGPLRPTYPREVLRVFLGASEFQERNWEGLLDKVEVKLSKWRWLLPLFANNLAASML